MMIGVAIAKLAGKRFVGFIDADNFVPGSVHEYCKVYAAGLHYALQSAKPGETDPYAMVRINWKSKPKVKDGKLVFEESGRSSRVVNEWFNRLLNELDDSRTRENFIKTGNAGEHVMSLISLCNFILQPSTPSSRSNSSTRGSNSGFRKHLALASYESCKFGPAIPISMTLAKATDTSSACKPRDLAQSTIRASLPRRLKINFGRT
jgi:hypothetical protein